MDQENSMLQRNRHAEHGRVENIQHSQPVGILNPDIATKLPEKGKLFLDLLLIMSGGRMRFSKQRA